MPRTGAPAALNVIAITDHVLMKKDRLARVGRLATLGRRRFGITEEVFDAYLALTLFRNGSCIA